MVNIGVLLLRVVAGSTVAALGAQRRGWCGEPTVAGLGSRLHRLSPRLGEGRETIGGLRMIRRQHRRGDRPSDLVGVRAERRAGPRDWRGPPGPRPSQPVVWS